MTRREIKEFLILLLNKEMEEEWRTTDHKDFIRECIEAKRFLLDGDGSLMAAIDLQDDIDKYIKEDEAK